MKGIERHGEIFAAGLVSKGLSQMSFSGIGWADKEDAFVIYNKASGAFCAYSRMCLWRMNRLNKL